ncbi:MAG: winged helix-turn-helix domain-containing protein, partial [Ramlibacter sp.]|nr:winged helix-turn-helix domain-containing protein [Ramlibacter sp.]
MNAPERNLRIGHGQFDPLSGDLTLGGRSARLRPRTSVLLGYLLSHPDRVVGKDELMQAVWPDVVVTEDSLVKCVKEIRQALGEEGRDWIRTSPRQGYAFVGAPAAPLPAQPVPSPPAALPDRQRRFRVAAGAMAALVLVFAVGLVGWQQTDLSSTAYPTHSLVVLPVVNQTGDPARDNAVDDLTEALIDSLGTIHRATVIAPGTAFQYKGRAADARSIGRELKVRYLLAGTLRMNGDRTVLAARLVSTETAVLLLSQDFPLGPGGMPELREDVLDGVAITLGLRLVHAEAERSGRAEAIRAAETLSQARSILRWQPDAAGVAKARALLEEAVRDDPRLPLGWAMLASTYLHDARFNAEREQQLKRAAEAIARAVAIAPDSAAVRMIEGRVLYEQGSMPQALAAFERCIEINPSHAWAHGLKAAALVMLGR